MTNMKLLTDQALGDGTELDCDGLGFSTYADVLADAALGTPGPFTIGVFGEWGTGKTSLMRMVKDNLDKRDKNKNEKILTIWFDAWKFEKEEHPIIPLVTAVIEKLEENKGCREKLADKIETLKNGLRALIYGISFKAKVNILGSEVGIGVSNKDMVKREEELTQGPLLGGSLYIEAFKLLKSIELFKDTRIVMIIDDLDRCFPDLAINLLESIKLALSQEGFVFIVGVARTVIEGYLKHRYEKEYGLSDFQGESYLDKIIQLPFFIPPHTSRLEDFSESILNRLDENVSKQLKGIIPLISNASGGNPRTTIRFVNNLLIDLAIYKGSKGIDNDPIKYFVVSRCLQQRWPKVFSILIGSDELCGQVAEWKPEQLYKQTSSDNPETKILATAIISDRDLKQLLNTDHGKSWLKNTEIRQETVHFLKAQRPEGENSSENKAVKFDLFIGYSDMDKVAVSQITEILADKGLKVLMDTGDDLGENPESGLLEARAAAFCISPNTRRDAKRLKKLMAAAVKRQKSKENFLIFPVLLPETDIEHLIEPLDNYQFLKLESLAQEPLQRFAEQLKSRWY